MVLIIISYYFSLFLTGTKPDNNKSLAVAEMGDHWPQQTWAEK